MKLTVIIPAYNAADTLANAIESVLASFTNQEIIIIDDGSNDATGQICDQYAAEHKNVIVTHTENGGVSRARNLGIERATGDYIMFMDADDQIIYDGALDLDSYIEDCDMILFSFNEKKMDGKLLNAFVLEDRIIKKDEVPNAFLENKYVFYGPWAKIYRKELILRKKIKFNDDQKYGEDIVFVLKYLSCISKAIRLLSNVFYSHYINPNGASYYNKYYHDMNQCLFNQLKAFETLMVGTRLEDKKTVDDFACSLFNDAILHYYQRLTKSKFSEKYLETYTMFAPYLNAAYLRNYSLFKFLNNNTALTEPAVIEKVYQKNLLLKAKHECKKIIYRYL